jgi:hypothetical protein
MSVCREGQELLRKEESEAYQQRSAASAGKSFTDTHSWNYCANYVICTRIGTLGKVTSTIGRIGRHGSGVTETGTVLGREACLKRHCALRSGPRCRGDRWLCACSSTGVREPYRLRNAPVGSPLVEFALGVREEDAFTATDLNGVCAAPAAASLSPSAGLRDGRSAVTCPILSESPSHRDLSFAGWLEEYLDRSKVLALPREDTCTFSPSYAHPCSRAGATMTTFTLEQAPRQQPAN